MMLVLCVVIMLAVQHTASSETTVREHHHWNDVHKAIFTLSKYFPEIFLQKQNLFIFSDCTKVFINAENTSSHPPPIHGMHEALNLIISHPQALRSTNLKLRHSSACSIVVYTTSQVNRVGSYDEDLISFFPGDTVFSFHFIVETSLPSESFWNLPFVRRVSNILLLIPILENRGCSEETCNFSILTTSRFGSGQRYLKIGEVSYSELRINVGTSSHSGNVFGNKWKNMKGDELRIGVPPTVKQQAVINYREKRKYRYLSVLMSEVSYMLNASVKYVPNDISSGNGVKLKNGTWTSYIGKLMSDTIDITVPFTPFTYQYVALSMSKGVLFTPFKFFAPLPKKMDMTLKFLIEPFDESIWIALFFCILGNVAVIYFLMNSSDQISGSSRDRIYFVALKITDFVRVLIDQPIPDDVLDTTGYGSGGPRLIYLVWLLIMIVVGNLYKSVVISILVQPVYVSPPLTIPELVNSDFHLNFLLYRAFQWDKRLPWVKNLKYPVTDFTWKFQGCLQTLLNGSNVCAFAHNYLYLYASETLIDTAGRRQFIESKDSFYATSSFFGISRLNPQFNEAIDRVVEVIVEGALDNHWVKMQFLQSALQTIHRKQKTTAEEGLLEDTLVDKELMLYPILILIAGLVIAIVCFAVEHFYFRWFKSRESQNGNMDDNDKCSGRPRGYLSSYDLQPPAISNVKNRKYYSTFPNIVMVNHFSANRTRGNY